MIWDIVRAIDRGTLALGEGGGYLNNLVFGFEGCPATLSRLIGLTSCLEYLDWPEDIHPYECDIREEASALVAGVGGADGRESR